MKKKIISLMLATACVALMCGCGAGSDEESKQTESTTSVSENAVNENIEYNAEDYVALGEYKGVAISVPAMVEYEEEDYEIETKSYYFNYIYETEGVTDRPVALYDMTNINYVGKKDGVAFEGGTAEGASLLIGSGQFIDGFEEGLIGVMPGETVDLNLTFPEAYHSADLAGQEVVFTVTVNYIAEMEDERVAELGITDVTTVDGLKQYVKDAMDEQAKSEYLMTAGSAAIKQVVANSQYEELPEALLEENRQAYMDYLDQTAAMYGMDGASYVAAVGGGVTYEEIVNEYATVYTQEILAAKAIAQKEGMIPTDEEVQKRLEEYAASANVTVDALLSADATLGDYKDSFIYEDVMNFLVENAVNTPAK